MSEVTDADIDQRIHKIAEWLEVNAPYCAAEHRHLDEGTAERAYWHFGYLCALHDMQAVLRAERAKVAALTEERDNARGEITSWANDYLATELKVAELEKQLAEADELVFHCVHDLSSQEYNRAIARHKARAALGEG